MLKQIQQWLLPNICCLCEKQSQTDRDLCLSCQETLPWVEDRCFRCGLELEDFKDSICCQQCREDPPEFNRLCTLFSYESPITKLVMGLKFGERLAYGRILGELLADAVFERWYKQDLPEAILPVPLHIDRLRKRGFNQALELSWPVHKRCKIPVLLTTCVRVKNTLPQAKLDKSRRKRNMQGVFQLQSTLPFTHIAIVDDVVTTGSTVQALCRVLKEAGVQQIDVWCICRA